MGIDLKNRKHRAVEKTGTWEDAPWIEKNVEEIKASRKSEDTDDTVDILVYGPFAIRLTHLFIKGGWSANAVTLLSLAFGLCGGILFYPQNRWVNLVGIVLVIFAAILDCCDGQIARLTHTSSQLGRVLDGAVDITNYLAIYIALGLRMMKETIPFTGTVWSFYIWIVILAAMFCHASQARMADYFRGLHLFFMKGGDRAYCARSKDLERELKDLKKGSPLYERIYRILYLIYTKDQERQTPRLQRLLQAIENNGGTVSQEATDVYVARSRKYIQLTNLLTYNIRTFALFILLIVSAHAFYFPFVIVVLELVKCFMVVKYEAIADDVYATHFRGVKSMDQNVPDADGKDE